MAVDKGWVANVDKTAPQLCPGSTYTPLRFNGVTKFAFEPGPTIFNAQIYWSIPTSGKGARYAIQFQRYLSDGSTDPTATFALPTVTRGTVQSASVVALEYVSAGVLWGVNFWHDAVDTVDVSVGTRIFKALNPSAYAASRLDIG